ncbi:hypothetical protein C1646_761455, partial [Rhizophagus diaphanus]
NWIHETDDIDGVEDVPQNRPTADLNALDQFLAEIRGTPVNAEPLKVTKTVIQQSSPQKLKCKVVTRKSSKKLPVPPKPNHLKTKSTIKEKSVAIIKETVTENDVNDFLEYLLSYEPSPSNSSPIKSEPPVKPESTAPETAKKNTIEPLNLPVGKLVTGKELVKILEAYQENKNAEIIPVPSGYQTMKLNKSKAVEPRIEDYEMEREWEKANGIIDKFDDEGFENICEDLGTF